MTEYGRLVPPFPVEACQLGTCRQRLTDELGAYLFTDLDTRKLVVFCGGCAPVIELGHADRFRLVML